MKNLAIIIILLITTASVYAQVENQKPAILPDNTDIHYSSKYCSECHEHTPRKGGETYLKFGGDFTNLCRCHGYTPGTYIHPVFIKPSEEKRGKIPKEFPLVNGMVTCTTCHNMYLQCQDNPRYKDLNKRFLRGAPYVKRTDLCFHCHDEKQYAMLDPHNQITETGEIVEIKCLYCHKEKPEAKSSTFKDVKLIGKLEVLCFRCHFKQSHFHPINANHLRVPSEKILANMEEAEVKYGIILPLDDEGKITCPTCHNPHERGIIPKDRASSKGASEKYRLRMSEANLQICVACHKDKFILNQ